MKYNFYMPMRSYNGVCFVQNKQEGTTNVQVPMTLKDMIENSLVNADPQEFNTADSKLAIYRLLRKVHSADSQTHLSAEEVATIQKVAAKNMTVTALGAIYDALENPESTFEKKESPEE